MESRAEIKVIKFWRRMGHSELSVVAPGDLDGYYRSIEHPFWVAWRALSRRDASVGIRLKLPSWYRLQPETEEIVKAFPRVSLLRERAADSKDLAVVESALTDLGTFLYTEITNVPGAAPPAALERVGTDSLLSFAKKVNALPAYKRQPRKPEPARTLAETPRYSPGLADGNSYK
jgi:hypothetical protein